MASPQPNQPLKTPLGRRVRTGIVSFVAAVILAGCSGSSDSGTASTTTNTGATASTEYILRFTDAVTYCGRGCPPGVNLGDSLTVDYVVDNGASKISNTWDYEHMKSVTFSAGTWSATINPRLGTPKYSFGSFRTDASGALTGLPEWGQGSNGIGPGQNDSNGAEILGWYTRPNEPLTSIIAGYHVQNNRRFSIGPDNAKDITKWSIR